jgi:hypothetical protein
VNRVGEFPSGKFGIVQLGPASATLEQVPGPFAMGSSNMQPRPALTDCRSCNPTLRLGHSGCSGG